MPTNNQSPDEKEWEAYRDLTLGEWAPDSLDAKLRMIVQYARGGRFFPADMHVQLIKEVYETERATWERQARLDELERSFANLLPQTQHPDPGNDDPWMRVHADVAHSYRIDRRRELEQPNPERKAE